MAQDDEVAADGLGRAVLPGRQPGGGHKCRPRVRRLRQPRLPAFADRPVLSGGKSEQTATATIKCDAKPGLYTVFQYDKDSSQVRQEVWARYRVVAADESTQRSCTAGKPALAGADFRKTL